MKKLSKFGMAVPDILLPKNKDLSTWSVIACDQFTQDRDYWKKVAEKTENKPSALNMILPEVYLGDGDKAQRIAAIQSAMRQYMADGVFDDEFEGLVYVERTTAYGRVRKGLVCAIDLDSYEWKPMSSALIRATEATIVDRIPPRKEIRRAAVVEMPHIMLLVNDPDLCLVEEAGKAAVKKSPCYDGKLMMDSGSIKGWPVTSEEEIAGVEAALEKLYKKNTSRDGSVFMFAVGDGNHSLATAKAVWDEYRQELLSRGASPEEVSESPVRYALVEIVNIYDEGLTFEPIHRVLFYRNQECSAEKTISLLANGLGGSVEELKSFDELESAVKKSKASFGFTYTEENSQKFILLKTEIQELAVSKIQPLLDEQVKAFGMEIDYIHGSDEVFRLGREKDSLSILLPPVAKDSFFSTISGSGPLPRKSFSMGEASEKRFYLECRKLFD